MDLGLELIKDSIGTQGKEGKGSLSPREKDDLEVKSVLTESDESIESEDVIEKSGPDSSAKGFAKSDFASESPASSNDENIRDISQSLGPTLGENYYKEDSEISSSTAKSIIKDKMKGIKSFDEISRVTEEEDEDEEKSNKIENSDKNSIKPVNNQFITKPEPGLNIAAGIPQAKEDKSPTFYYPGGTKITQPDLLSTSF
ncbi:protein with signal peptide plus transmembrane domain or GPI anchor, partial [Cryptosporidium felis]